MRSCGSPRLPPLRGTSPQALRLADSRRVPPRPPSRCTPPRHTMTTTASRRPRSQRSIRTAHSRLRHPHRPGWSHLLSPPPPRRPLQREIQEWRLHRPMAQMTMLPPVPTKNNRPRHRSHLPSPHQAGPPPQPLKPPLLPAQLLPAPLLAPHTTHRMICSARLQLCRKPHPHQCLTHSQWWNLSRAPALLRLPCLIHLARVWLPRPARAHPGCRNPCQPHMRTSGNLKARLPRTALPPVQPRSQPSAMQSSSRVGLSWPRCLR